MIRLAKKYCGRFSQQKMIAINFEAVEEDIINSFSIFYLVDAENQIQN
jgi:hypothetical protein